MKVEKEGTVIDVEKIAQALLARGYRAGDEPKVEVGLYALFVDNSAVVPPLTIGENGLLYIGMTTDNTGARNHFELPSGSSSPRRSLGALLKDELHLCAIRRGSGDSPKNWENYRFSDEGEAALTRWMKNHLSMNSVPLSGVKAKIEQVERQLITQLKPPLNLKGGSKTPAHKQLEALRKACREEARGGQQ